MTPITTPQVIEGLDEIAYHADPCIEPSLSSSMAKTILRPGGPARLKQILDYGEQRKKVFDFGSAAHERILGRGQPVKAIDGNRNAKAVKDEIAEAEAEGFLVLKSDEVARIDAMVEAILAHPVAAELLTAGAGKPELSMFDINPETGRWLRGRIDFLHSPQVVVDYKTASQPVDAERWSRHAWDYGYHTQAAPYLRLAVQLGLCDPDAAWLWIAQETTPPYLVAVHQASTELLDAGNTLLGRAITLWDRCLTLDDWPGLPTTITPIGLPHWADLTESEE